MLCLCVNKSNILNLDEPITQQSDNKIDALDKEPGKT